MTEKPILTPNAAIVDAVAWCRQHNALVRFESNGTVTVKMNNVSRRRANLVESVNAHRDGT